MKDEIFFMNRWRIFKFMSFISDVSSYTIIDSYTLFTWRHVTIYENANNQVYLGRKLASKYDKGQLQWGRMSWEQRYVLSIYWSGRLQAYVEELQRRHGYGQGSAPDRAPGLGVHRWARDTEFRVQR